tara:strand:- start:629 stop:835 length:207 start_codon:yes stop_codon:yes gene_type:complete
MGRAIDVDKKLDDLERDIKQLKTAFKGLSSTVESFKDTASSKKNIDLHEEVESEPKESKKKELVKEEA